MTNEEILEKLNHKDGLIKTVEIHKAMEAARKDEAERCLRFAEWAYTNGWCFVEGEVWINYDESVKPTTNTTSELYQIFKTQTNG